MPSSPLQTFDTDSTTLQAYLPQVGFEGVGDLYDLPNTTKIVEHAAGNVCGILLGISIDPAEVATDTASSTYQLAQKMVALMALPYIVQGIEGLGVEAQDQIQKMHDRADAEIARLRKNPAMWGWTANTDINPRAKTTRKFLGLKTDQTSNRARRRWDGDDQKKQRW